MNNAQLRQLSSVKLPQPNGDAKHEQYGRERGGIVECPECHSVHYKKRWYRSRRVLKPHLKDGRAVALKKHLCPACSMIREHLFEGEVLVEAVPQHYRQELIRLIKNFGKRAEQIDAQHRVIEIEKNPNATADAYRITTTENQLAARLAKKIKEVFNTVELHISHSREPYEVGRVRVVFY